MAKFYRVNFVTTEKALVSVIVKAKHCDAAAAMVTCNFEIDNSIFPDAVVPPEKLITKKTYNLISTKSIPADQEQEYGLYKNKATGLSEPIASKEEEAVFTKAEELYVPENLKDLERLLLNCPFCGDSVNLRYDTHTGKYAVDCHTTKCILGDWTSWYASPSMLITDWNTRNFTNILERK